MSADEIIARCTRDGHVSWQHVAAQLGRSVDSVRAQFDQTYMRAHIWAPERGARPEMEPDPADVFDIEDTSSPHPKGPGLKVLILGVLANGAESAELIAIRLQRPVNSIRARLDRLQGDFLVCHDGCYPRTWSLTAKGLRIHVTGCEVRVKARA